MINGWLLLLIVVLAALVGSIVWTETKDTIKWLERNGPDEHTDGLD